jgi:hypothetical protein
LQPLVAFKPPRFRCSARFPSRDRHIDRHVDEHGVGERANQECSCRAEVALSAFFRCRGCRAQRQDIQREHHWHDLTKERVIGLLPQRPTLLGQILPSPPERPQERASFQRAAPSKKPLRAPSRPDPDDPSFEPFPASSGITQFDECTFGIRAMHRTHIRNNDLIRAKPLYAAQ